MMDNLEPFQYDEVVHDLLVDCMKNNALIQEYRAKEEFYKNSLDASNQTIEALSNELKILQLENKSLKVLKTNEQELLDRINELNLTVQKKDLEIQSMQNKAQEVSAQITRLAQLLKEKSEYPQDSKKQVKQNDDTKEAVPDLNFLNTENNSAIKQNEEIENNRNIQNSSNIFQYESDSESTPAQNSPCSIIFEHTIDLLDSSVHDFDSAKLKVEEINANQSDSSDSDDELEDLQERNNSTRSSSLSFVTDSTLENFDREHKSPNYIILSSNDEIQAKKTNEEKKKSKKSKNKKKKKSKSEQKLKRKRTDSSDSQLPDLHF